MCNFRVGQKVVCVDDEFPGGRHPDLFGGGVYTITAIVDSNGSYRGEIDRSRAALLLKEVRDKYAWPGRGWTDRFRADRFRPLVAKKTDISIFQEMLKTKELENV